MYVFVCELVSTCIWKSVACLEYVRTCSSVRIWVKYECVDECESLCVSLYEGLRCLSVCVCVFVNGSVFCFPM